MGKLIYFTPTSLDGYLGDESIGYEWSAPDEEVFAFITERMRPIRTYLYGRKMYETMAVWQTPEVIPGFTASMREFAHVWQAAEKIVFSGSRAAVSTENTRIERRFDPEAVRELKARSPHDLSVGGPNLAAHALRAGLVDEYQLLIVPAMIGGGHRVLPPGASTKLELLEQRRFGNDWLFVRYRRQRRA